MSDRHKVKCTGCDGHGTVEVETYITDYNNGHDIWTDTFGCETCCGQGWLWNDEIDWEEEE